MLEPIDILIRGDTVVTMDPDRSIITDGAVAVRGGRIIAVDTWEATHGRFEPDEILGGSNRIVMPGLINAHQHLTGDRLIRSTIPDDLPPGAAITEWAIPVHAAHTPDDEELSATLALVEAVTNGITFTVEAGTVLTPERVLAAYDAVGVGGTLGTWGWDVETASADHGRLGAGSVREVIDRQRHVRAIVADHPTVSACATLVGHDLMSDELVQAASAFAVEHGSGLTFHLSPSVADTDAYLARVGRRPVEHLADLGVLGPHLLIAHAVHLGNTELELLLDHHVAIASCPWAYLRLGQGMTTHGRHAEFVERGGRLGVGCDSENAGDAIDVLLAARLFAGIAKDAAEDPTLTPAHIALELATISGAAAIGMEGEIGSLEVDKRADVVVIDTTRPEWIPTPSDPILPLIWASDGRAVSDVVAGGRVVVRDGSCVTVDLTELASRSRGAHQRLVSSQGAHTPHQ